MTYRRIRPEDKEKIAELCAKHGIEYDNRVPLIGFVAISNDGNLVGVSLTHSVILLEPFIAERPTIAVKLHYMTEGAVSAVGSQAIVAHISKENSILGSELERLGFVKIDKPYVLYKKVL